MDDYKIVSPAIHLTVTHDNNKPLENSSLVDYSDSD